MTMQTAVTTAHLLVDGDLLCKRLRNIILHADDSCILLCRRLNRVSAAEERHLHHETRPLGVCSFAQL